MTSESFIVSKGDGDVLHDKMQSSLKSVESVQKILVGWSSRETFQEEVTLELSERNKV